MGVLTINITPEIYQEAEKRNLSYKKRYGNTGTHRLNKDRQRMTGYLAEASIRSYFPKLNYSDNDNVDFIIDSITIDSKAQGCNTKPLDNYVGTLYEEQKARDVDYYVFSRIKNDFSIAWICGAISKKDFFDLSTLVKAGTTNNNFTYDQSRYEIQYNKLIDIKSFLNQIGSYNETV
jgi:hypothetical protein